MALYAAPKASIFVFRRLTNAFGFLPLDTLLGLGSNFFYTCLSFLRFLRSSHELLSLPTLADLTSPLDSFFSTVSSPTFPPSAWDLVCYPTIKHSKYQLTRPRLQPVDKLQLFIVIRHMLEGAHNPLEFRHISFDRMCLPQIQPRHSSTNVRVL